MTTRRLMDELRLRLAPAAQPSAALSALRHGSARAPTGRVHAPRRAGEVPLRPAEAQGVKDPRLLEQLKAATPAKIGVGRAGLRYRTETLLQFLSDFALAKAAVESQVPDGFAESHGWIPLSTLCEGPEQFLARPDLGRQLSPQSLAEVSRIGLRGADVQIVVGDGLSATAVMQNAPSMVATLLDELAQRGHTVGSVFFVKHCRAKIIDVIGAALGSQVGVILLGERPGLGTGDGMSAYLVWQPALVRTDAEKQAISNIHRRGILPDDAGRFAAAIIAAIAAQRTSGVNLDLGGLTAPRAERTRINQAHGAPLAGCGQSHGQGCTCKQHGDPGSACQLRDARPCDAIARR